MGADPEAVTEAPTETVDKNVLVQRVTAKFRAPAPPVPPTKEQIAMLAAEAKGDFTHLYTIWDKFDAQSLPFEEDEDDDDDDEGEEEGDDDASLETSGDDDGDDETNDVADDGDEETNDDGDDGADDSSGGDDGAVAIVDYAAAEAKGDFTHLQATWDKFDKQSLPFEEDEDDDDDDDDGDGDDDDDEEDE